MSDHAYGAAVLPRVAAVLAAAEISPDKVGDTRAEVLGEEERALYHWILRRFASSGRPSMEAVAAEADRLGLDLERALATLAREDLLHRGGDGEIAVAYPFSGRATAHRVRFPSGQEEYAMCALDALGIAAMFEQAVEIASRDPLTDAEIRARLSPDGACESVPGSAVVVTGTTVAHGPESSSSCCPVLSFFASADNAERWLSAQSEVRGHVVSIADAAAAGRAVFGGVLDRS
jgi:hypothetical protein